MSMKNSNNTIGNRTLDLPACSTVPQPTGARRGAYRVFVGKSEGKIPLAEPRHGGGGERIILTF
jgi:hypothetical protein